MFKKTLCILIAMLTLVSAASVCTFSASAEEVSDTLATADEATFDEATSDEAELKISDEPKADASSVDGTVIGYIGDTNADGKINVKDATAIQKHLAKLISLGEQAKYLGDADNNEKLNVRDATTIQKYIAGIEVKSYIWHLLYETGTHKHNYVETVVEPKCETAGYTSYSCICGDEYKENETEAAGHSYSSKVVAATCVEDGFTEYICNNCQHSYKDKFTNATGVHNFENGNCKFCGQTNQKLLVNSVVEYVIENGEYDKEKDVYLFEVEPFFNYEYAFLTAQKGANVFVYTFMVNFDDGYDIVSLAFSEEKEEVDYYMFCSGYFECMGYWKMGNFTANVSDSEFYFYVDGISKEEALDYTMEHIYTGAEVLFMGESLPESIRDLVL